MVRMRDDDPRIVTVDDEDGRWSSGGWMIVTGARARELRRPPPGRAPRSAGRPASTRNRVPTNAARARPCAPRRRLPGKPSRAHGVGQHVEGHAQVQAGAQEHVAGDAAAASPGDSRHGGVGYHALRSPQGNPAPPAAQDRVVHEACSPHELGGLRHAPGEEEVLGARAGVAARDGCGNR